jgi:hypothetical protein
VNCDNKGNQDGGPKARRYKSRKIKMAASRPSRDKFRPALQKPENQDSDLPDRVGTGSRSPLQNP